MNIVAAASGRRGSYLSLRTTGLVRILLMVALCVAPMAVGAGDAGGKPLWPTHGWSHGTPTSVGLDEAVLVALDNDIASGKYSLVDSFQVFRCGQEIRAAIRA